jgi:hypothetical protein
MNDLYRSKMLLERLRKKKVGSVNALRKRAGRKPEKEEGNANALRGMYEWVNSQLHNCRGSEMVGWGSDGKEKENDTTPERSIERLE